MPNCIARMVLASRHTQSNGRHPSSTTCTSSNCSASPPLSFKRSFLFIGTTCPQKSYAAGTCIHALPTGLHWFTHTHKKTLENPSGEFLKTKCVINYSSTMIQLGKALHGNPGTDATKLFFDYLTEGSMSEPAMWLRTLKQKIHRFLFQRVMNAGECGSE